MFRADGWVTPKTGPDGVEGRSPRIAPLRLASLLVAALVGLTGCDSGPDDACGPAADSVSPGTFAFQFEEPGACFELRGESARYNVRLPSASDDRTVLGQFLPDDPGESTDANTTFIQFLAVGDAPLAVGTYEIADLYTPTTAMLQGRPVAPPAGDVRLIEYPGQVALQAVLSRDENLYSRSGTITVTSTGPDGFSGRIDATLARQVTTGGTDRPGAVVRMRGAFAIDRDGASFFIFL